MLQPVPGLWFLEASQAESAPRDWVEMVRLFRAVGAWLLLRETAAVLGHSGTLEATWMNRAPRDLFFKDIQRAVLPFSYKGHRPAFAPSRLSCER